MTGRLRRWICRRWRHVTGEGGFTEPGQRSEEDVQVDRGVARTRATGGVPDPAAPDQHSSTGTTPTGTFVGRVAGDDAWSGETGAEVRGTAGRARLRRGPGRAEPARGRTPGPVIGEVFTADSDAEAAAHLYRGPFVDRVPGAVAVGELTPVEFDALQALLTGVSFRDVLGSGGGGLVEAASRAGPWLSRVRPGLVGALAAMDPADVPRVAVRWAGAEEVSGVPVETLTAVLAPLSDLAREATEGHRAVYLWNSL